MNPYSSITTGPAAETPNLVIPYYVPYIDNNSIKFRLNTSEPAPSVGSIPLSTLKGEDGHIAIQMINTLPSLASLTTS